MNFPCLLLLLLLLLPLRLFAQTTHLTLGPGLASLSNDAARPQLVGTAGLSLENPIAERWAFTLGLHYRQRGSREDAADVRIHYALTDFGVRFQPWPVLSVGVGGYYALACGNVTWREVDGRRVRFTEAPENPKYGDDVGGTAFAGYRLSDRWSVRLMYDHGLNDILSGGTERNRALYLMAAYRLGTVEMAY